MLRFHIFQLKFILFSYPINSCTYFNSVRTRDAMDAEEFRKRAKEMVDYVADYLENIRDRRPLSSVRPGYLRELIPDEAPRDPEPWDDVFRDIERVIMPGVSILNSFR